MPWLKRLCTRYGVGSQSRSMIQILSQLLSECIYFLHSSLIRYNLGVIFSFHWLKPLQGGYMSRGTLLDTPPIFSSSTTVLMAVKPVWRYSLRRYRVSRRTHVSHTTLHMRQKVWVRIGIGRVMLGFGDAHRKVFVHSLNSSTTINYISRQ